MTETMQQAPAVTPESTDILFLILEAFVCILMMCVAATAFV